MTHNAPKVETLYFCPDTGERVESRVACRMAGHGHDARAEEYVPRAQARRVVVTFPDGEVPLALARALSAIESAGLFYTIDIVPAELARPEQTRDLIVKRLRALQKRAQGSAGSPFALAYGRAADDIASLPPEELTP